MTILRLALVVVCLQLAQAPVGSARIQGRVVRVGSTDAVAHASIVLAKVGGEQADYRTIVADDAGRFAFANLAAGSYRVYAEHDGYVRTEFGKRGLASPAGTPIVLTDAQVAPDATISMTPTGAIAGRVLDRGKPMRNAWVRALRPSYFNGNRSFSIADWAQTDDRGDYRLFGLTPGFYFVSAVPPSQPRRDGDTLVLPVVPSTANGNRGELRSPLTAENLPIAASDTGIYVATYHSGVTDVGQATPIEVRSGETTNGIELNVTRVATYHVRGRIEIEAAEAATIPPLRVVVSPLEYATNVSVPSVTDTNRTFDLSGVPPGRYNLSSNTPAPIQPPGGVGLYGTVPIEVVDRDLDNLLISVKPGVKVVGRVTYEGDPPVTPPAVLVQLQGASGLAGTSAVPVQPDGTFTMPNVPQRDYGFRVIHSTKNPWVKSARFGAIDVMSAPIHVDADAPTHEFQIVVSSNAATLDAVVLDASQKPVAGVLFMAVPDAARRNRSDLFRSATTDAEGRVHLTSVTPGDYRLFASENVEVSAWYDPAVLRKYESQGVLVRLAPGATANAKVGLLK